MDYDNGFILQKTVDWSLLNNIHQLGDTLSFQSLAYH